MDKIELFYRINTVAEKALFEDFKDFYEGVVINAHFAAFYSKWMPVFLTNLNKSYFIDPVTYVFAKDLDAIKKDDDLKKSYAKLRNAFGGKFKEITENRQLMPKDFQADESLREFAQNVLDFQRKLVADPAQTSLHEYLEILGKKDDRIQEPTFLIPPYFYFTSFEDPWYKISLEAAKISLELKPKNKLFPIICTSKSMLLNDNFSKRLQQDYSAFDGYLLFISDFRERDDDVTYLAGLIKLIRDISQSKKPVYILYGGYFPLILSKFGLTGYAKSICYGESKKVDIEAPITNARLPKNFYMDLIHQKLSETIARAFYSDNPEYLCKCNICSNILSRFKSQKDSQISERFFDLISFTTEAKAHFIVTHYLEKEDISKLTIDELIKKLQDEFETSQKLNVDSYNIHNSYLCRWINAIERHY